MSEPSGERLDSSSAEVPNVGRQLVSPGLEVGGGEPRPGVGVGLVAADRLDRPAVALGEVDEVDVLVGHAAVDVDVDVLEQEGGGPRQRLDLVRVVGAGVGGQLRAEAGFLEGFPEGRFVG